MPVLVVDKQIDVDSNLVQNFNIFLLEISLESCLVYLLLHGVQRNIESLVLADNWAPEVENFIHRVLFKPRQTDGFLQDERVVLQEVLTVVRCREKTRHLGSTPNYESFLLILVVVQVVVHIVVEVIILVIKVSFLVRGYLCKHLLKAASF